MNQSTPPPTLHAEACPEYWICWTTNYSRKNDGYICHAMDPSKPGKSKGLCGVKIEETSGLEIIAGKNEPGCIRCRRKLRTLGILPEML